MVQLSFFITYPLRPGVLVSRCLEPVVSQNIYGHSLFAIYCAERLKIAFSLSLTRKIHAICITRHVQSGVGVQTLARIEPGAKEKQINKQKMLF